MGNEAFWELVRILGLVGGVVFYVSVAAFAIKVYESVGVCP